MTTTNTLSRQPTKMDYASPNQFKFNITKLPKVEYFCTPVNVPALAISEVQQPTPFVDIPLPGTTLNYSTLNMTFIVDENLENYLEIYNWIRGLGYPESLQEIIDFQRTGKVDKNPYGKEMDIYSDGTLIIQTSNFVPNFQIKFRSKL